MTHVGKRGGVNRGFKSPTHATEVNETTTSNTKQTLIGLRSAISERKVCYKVTASTQDIKDNSYSKERVMTDARD